MTLDEQLAAQDASYGDAPAPAPAPDAPAPDAPAPQGLDAVPAAQPSTATTGGIGVGLEPKAMADIREHTARVEEYQTNLMEVQRKLEDDPTNKDLLDREKHFTTGLGVSIDIVNSTMKALRNWGDPNADPNVDYTNELEGAFGFRAGLGTKDSREERINHITKNAGPEGEGWRRLTDGTVVITPQGHRNLGIEPPSHGRDVPLDSPSTSTWGDVADASGEIGTIAGSTAAGLATMGPVGGVGGALRGIGMSMLGAGAGSLAQEGVEESLGENMQPPLEVMKDVGVDTAVGAIGAPIRGTAGMAGRRALAPFGVGDARKLADVEDALSRGFKPAAGGINENTIFSYAENFGHKLFGDKARTEANTNAAYGGFARAAGNDVVANPLNKETFGTAIRDQVLAKRTELSRWAKDTYTPLFQKLDDVGGGVHIPMDNFAKLAEDLLEGGMKNSEGKTVSGLSTGARAQLDDFVKLGGMRSTPSELQKLRTDLREASFDDKLFPDSSRTHLKALKTKLDEMLDPDALGQMYKDAGMGTLYPGQKKLLTELKEANTKYGKEARNQDIGMLQRIAKDPTSAKGVAPENVADIIFDGAGGRHVNASTLKALRKVFTPHQMKEVERLGFERLGKVLFKPGEAVDTLSMDPTAYVRMLNDIEPAPLREMFGAKAAAELKNYGRALQLTMGAKQKASGLALAAVALHPIRNLSTVAKMGALGWLLSKPAGRKWLTVGLTAPKTAKYTAAAASIATALTLHLNAGDGTSGSKIPDEGPN